MAGFYKRMSLNDKILNSGGIRFNRSKFMKWKLNRCPGTYPRWFAAFAVMAVWAAGLVLGEPIPAIEQFRKDVQPILNKYCSDCHADGAKKGGVAFDEFKSDKDLLQPELWLHALRNTRAGLMPPRKKPQPTDEERQTLERWIKYSAFGIDPKNPDPGRVTLRRLNRVEYRNTVHDLLGVDFNADAEFPPDDTGYGFDNIGDVLTISPMLLEKYLAAAKAIVGEAVPVVSGILPEQIIGGSQFRAEAGSSGGGTRGGRKLPLLLPFDAPAGVSNSFRATQAGTYQLTVDLAVGGEPDAKAASCNIIFKADEHELLNRKIASDESKPIRIECEQKWESGEHLLAFELRPISVSDNGSNSMQLRINAVTVRGPMEKKYWAKPANYDRFFPKSIPDGAAERRQYAGELLEKFATKAFRRPVDAKTGERLVRLAESVYTQPEKPFEAGVAHAMVATLASTRFLFRLEENIEAPQSASWTLVDEYSLASRLSYFLWSTMPDAELLELAGKGKLRENLFTQATRMLADSRSEALVVNFTGQWLQARDIGGLTINARAVFAREGVTGATSDAPGVAANPPVGQTPSTNLLSASGTPVNQRRLNFANGNGRRGFQPPVQLDGSMKRSMQKEAEMYVSNIIHEDRPVLELIQSDYIFANSNLAKVYGLTNMEIRGTELRKVSLPADSPRGGLLTAGAVLTVTSTPERTSPVKRGLFVLNNFLGLPVPPPPPDIPALEASEKDFKDRQPTLREALEVHRQNALCSSCHSRMDPIGLGLENFNALGVWREKERGQPIETAGQLVTGETFNSVQELKQILVTTHKSDFYRCLTEKLLTYALGRGPEYYDTETVDQIVLRLEKENGRFSALLNGIIESAPFQKQRTRAHSTLAENVEASAAGSKAKKSL